MTSQSYKNWELCLYDDCSNDRNTKKTLQNWEGKDQRIKIKYGEINQHISEATNQALKMATGEFVAFVDNDDEITENALTEISRVINKNNQIDFIYSDEDKIDKHGKRFSPYFKPDWNPDLLLSQMYTSHLSVYRKSIIDKVKGFRVGFEGSQDYDLVLRITDNLDPNRIHHIPKILYHWRALSGSTSISQDNKNYTTQSAIRALEDYLHRKNIKGSVVSGKVAGTYRVKRKIIGNPLVTIIIPFKDNKDTLDKCITSVLERTNYQNLEILLVNNHSQEKATKEYLEKIIKSNIRIIDYNLPFNFSKINNFAAKRARGDFLLLLNNDTEVINSEWLTALLEQAQREEVGAVGAQLIYPDDRVQHAGVVCGPYVARHAFKYLDKEDLGYFGHKEIIRDYLAVTGACLMINKVKYFKMEGLNENNLSIAYNDVDLCLRLIDKGYINVYTPYARMYHYESLSRGDETPAIIKQSNPTKYKRITSEVDYMRNKWKKYIDNDPLYSPNLTREREDFSIRE